MAFGERLQEVRKRSGLTQEEFAEQLQVSRQSVSRWESGRGYPEMEKIIFICNRYGVTMDELFKEEVPTAGRSPAAVRAHARQRVVKPVRESVALQQKHRDHAADRHRDDRSGIRLLYAQFERRSR
jgi:transcriptional regulator with XRE-family HTH domain